VCKSRIQSQLPVSLRTDGTTTLKYRNTLQTLYTVAREEGLPAIYKGFTPKAMRMAIGGGVSMVSFELACYLLPRFQQK
jgi:solute carrier family 25 2-oxodicarboxylate transporter 21